MLRVSTKLPRVRARLPNYRTAAVCPRERRNARLGKTVETTLKIRSPEIGELCSRCCNAASYDYNRRKSNWTKHGNKHINNWMAGWSVMEDTATSFCEFLPLLETSNARENAGKPTFNYFLSATLAKISVGTVDRG